MGYYEWQDPTHQHVLPAPGAGDPEEETIPESSDLAVVRSGALGPAQRRFKTPIPQGSYGARVGWNRKMEFSAGDRSQRIITGPYVT